MKNAKLSTQNLVPDATETKQGFTIIEVTLFLAITGLMLIGLLGSTYASIARQRYNDSVRSFSEFLRTIYAEVISPESLSGGNSDEYAIYGKAIVFGLPEADQDNAIYTATVVGDTKPQNESDNFVSELKNVHARLYCGEEVAGKVIADSTRTEYIPQWEARITKAYTNQPVDFKGTVIIARSPSSGTVHAAYTEETFPVDDSCYPDNRQASQRFFEALQNNPQSFETNDKIDFCVRSENSRIVRDVVLSLEGRNTSAINTLTDEEGENPCLQTAN